MNNYKKCQLESSAEKAIPEMFTSFGYIFLLWLLFLVTMVIILWLLFYGYCFMVIVSTFFGFLNLVTSSNTSCPITNI